METHSHFAQPTSTANHCTDQNKRNFVIQRVLRLLLLVFSVCIVWLTLNNRWGDDFQLPAVYARGDSLLVLGAMKLARDGDLGLFTHITTNSLGAPFKGQLNDWPQSERAIIWLGGHLARVIGLMPAANSMLILSSILAALSFYSAARLWRVSELAACFFSIVYAFLPHTHRSLSNLGIIFTGLLPLQLYVLWYISTVYKISWSSSRFRLTLIISALSGALNIYWIFLFLQLYTLALACRLIKHRRDFIKATIPILATFLIASSFLGSFMAYKITYGENPMAIVRSYRDIELFSLKPIDLFLPVGGGGLGLLSKYLSKYYAGGRLEIGEYWWGNYIGLCAVAGLTFLFLKGIKRQLNKRSTSLPLLAACWIIAYSSFGGGNSIFSLIFDFYKIRGTNRYAAAIATIGLLYFVFLVNRLIQKWPLRLKIPSLGLLSLLGIMDQSWLTNNPFLHQNFSPGSIRKLVETDKGIASRLEEILYDNSMIFMLPALNFPEPYDTIPIGRLKPYLYGSMAPFLYSTKLRYSYGSDKGRQGADWQLDVQELPAGKMAATLESYGFAGILLNRAAYEDRGEQLIAELAEAGWPMELEQGIDNQWVFIRLTPSEHPILPTLTPYALTSQKEKHRRDGVNDWTKDVVD